MSCYHPLQAFPDPSGGRLSFARGNEHSGRTIKLPCNQCIGCLLDRSSTWSTRMMHEASLHETSQFVTLTYDDDHLPDDRSLDQVHMQKFFKRLRKHFAPTTIRYVYSGEYGETYGRPHYHAIIYGLDPRDLQKRRKNDRGDQCYTSETIDQIWGKGSTELGDVTPQSCAYVASYILKDLKTGRWKDQWQEMHMETGEIIERQKPFARYSNKPGIGRAWFDKYHGDVFPDDFVVINGKKTATPKYYSKILKEMNPELFEKVAEKRERAINSLSFRKDATRSRLKVRETVRTAKVKQGKRGGADATL